MTEQYISEFNLKSQALSIVYGIGYLIAILIVIRLARFSTIQLVFFLIGLYSFNSFINGKFELYKLLKASLLIVIVIYTIKFLQPYGFWGYAAGIAIVSAAILYRKWPKYIKIKWHIETMIFGKRLRDFDKKPKLKLRL